MKVSRIFAMCIITTNCDLCTLSAIILPIFRRKGVCAKGNCRRQSSPEKSRRCRGEWARSLSLFVGGYLPGLPDRFPAISLEEAGSRTAYSRQVAAGGVSKRTGRRERRKVPWQGPAYPAGAAAGRPPFPPASVDTWARVRAGKAVPGHPAGSSGNRPGNCQGNRSGDSRRNRRIGGMRRERA